MNKTRQQELTRWLKQQSIISRRWLMISRLLGVASGLLIVAQAWFLARILHRMVMENIPATALLLPLTLLVTHQLEGLADWDDVWVMQDGQIIEQGDYATLARAGGVFSALLAHRQEEI